MPPSSDFGDNDAAALSFGTAAGPWPPGARRCVVEGVFGVTYNSQANPTPAAGVGWAMGLWDFGCAGLRAVRTIFWGGCF